jgi:dTDP-4-dehydrorhamnose reductase
MIGLWNGDGGVRKRVVVIGAGGRLGAALAAQYEGAFEVLPFAREQLDIGDELAVRAALEPLDFDYLILSAGLTAVDYCEANPRASYALNAQAAGVLGRLCAAKGAHMTYFSTDFVFAGDRPGGYSEEDEANPLSVYGASKLEGENQVLAASARHLVVRLSWLYGCRRVAFPEWIIQQAQGIESLSLPADKVASPSCCEDIARYLQALLRYDSGEPCGGLFHLCNSGACSWQEWGQECLDAAVRGGFELACQRIAPTRLSEVAAFVAARPPQSVLDCAKFTRITGIVPRSWQEALREHLARTLRQASPGALTQP